MNFQLKVWNLKQNNRTTCWPLQFSLEAICMQSSRLGDLISKIYQWLHSMGNYKSKLDTWYFWELSIELSREYRFIWSVTPFSMLNLCKIQQTKTFAIDLYKFKYALERDCKKYTKFKTRLQNHLMQWGKLPIQSLFLRDWLWNSSKKR